MGLNKFKQWMDEELKDIEVTDELKQNTLRAIEGASARKQRRVRSVSFYKGMTLLSSFILVLALSIQLFNRVGQGNEGCTNGNANLFSLTPSCPAPSPDANSDHKVGEPAQEGAKAPTEDQAEEDVKDDDVKEEAEQQP
jgi:hypothetical protein